MKAFIILADGFEDLEALGTIALLRRGGLEVDVATIETHKPTGKYGITVDAVPLETIDYQQYDIVVLPGGPGYRRLLESLLVFTIIKEFFRQKKYMAAICAAPTIFGQWGLLKGRRYTCFPGMEEDTFLGLYQADKVVIDDFLITGKAAGAVTDFALAILSVVFNQTTADEVRDKIYF